MLRLTTPSYGALSHLVGLWHHEQCHSAVLTAQHQPGAKTGGEHVALPVSTLLHAQFRLPYIPG